MDIFKTTLTEEIIYVYDNLSEAEEHAKSMVAKGYIKVSYLFKQYLDENLKEKVNKEYPHIIIHENDESYFNPPYYIYSSKYKRTLIES